MSNPWEYDEGDAALEEYKDAVERVLRIANLRYEAEKAANGPVFKNFQDAAHLPMELQEIFWQNVVDFESAPRMSRRKMLAAIGCKPLPSEDVDDELLTEALSDILMHLAEYRHFVTHTDHLSDRELYELLTRKILEEETIVFSSNSSWRCMIFASEYETKSEDSEDIYLKYYADEAEREHWSINHPGENLPARENPPFDRDRDLPSGEPQTAPMWSESDFDDVFDDEDDDFPGWDI